MLTILKSVNIRKSLQQILLIGMVLPLAGCDNFVNAFHGMTDFLVKLQTQYQYIVSLIIAIAYVSGAGFVMKSIFAFKIYGEQRTMMSSQTTIRVPITYLVIGMGLLFLPRIISIVTMSVFMTPTVDLMSYSGPVDLYDSLKTAVYGMVQIIGLISIMRAFFIMSHVQGGQQGGLGKAMTHFAGGIMAVNISHLIDIMNNEFS